jgi:hypothetical protein
MEWPDYDKAELLRFQKVINEPDLLPVHFIRILTQAAKLSRTHRGKLVPTPLGRRMLAAEQHGPLQALRLCQVYVSGTRNGCVLGRGGGGLRTAIPTHFSLRLFNLTTPCGGILALGSRLDASGRGRTVR